MSYVRLNFLKHVAQRPKQVLQSRFSSVFILRYLLVFLMYSIRIHVSHDLRRWCKIQQGFRIFFYKHLLTSSFQGSLITLLKINSPKGRLFLKAKHIHCCAILCLFWSTFRSSKSCMKLIFREVFEDFISTWRKIYIFYSIMWPCQLGQ